MVKLKEPKASIRSRGALIEISEEFIKNIPVHLELSTHRNFIFGQGPSTFLALLDSSFCTLNARGWRVGNLCGEPQNEVEVQKFQILVPAHKYDIMIVTI